MLRFADILEKQTEGRRRRVNGRDKEGRKYRKEKRGTDESCF